MTVESGFGTPRTHSQKDNSLRLPIDMSKPESTPLWEVFTQPQTGKPHEHAGSVHAEDAELALQNARDVFGRRGGVVSIWVVRASEIVASTPNDEGPFFDPAEDKVYRHPSFYKVPRGVRDI